MPIKFRCNYCRQFLGISRAQAGGIVDCPTCGRSIRVPQLDGSLQPLPPPELNLQDAHLSRALDELAKLGESDSRPVSKPVEPDGEFDEDADDDDGIPQLILEPIPIEVPIPPTPIAINPPVQDDDEIPEPPPGEGPASDRDNEVKSPGTNLLAELASLSPPASADQRDEEPRSTPTSSRRLPLSRTPLLQTVLMLAVAFVAGMLFERFVKVLESLRSSSSVSEKQPGDAKPEIVSQVTGRITYKSADGTSQPDRGARIIAFPPERAGEARLSVVGFRPADGDADAKLAAATLHTLGGALATADEAGQYRLDLPAGTYQLLVLSHFQSRGETEPVDPALLKLLGTYFDKPNELLGRVQFTSGPLRVKGTGDVWDHSF
jgi:hypothetical protein